MMKTQTFRKNIEKCDNIEEVKPLLQKHNTNDEWLRIFWQKTNEYNLNFDKLSKLCGVSYNTARSWEKKFPSKRVDGALLCMVFGFSVEETNRCFQRYGGTNELYARDYTDYILIYMLNNSSHYASAPKENYIRLLNEVKEYLQKMSGFNTKDSYQKTVILRKNALSHHSEDELISYFKEYHEEFEANRWEKFYKHIDSELKLIRKSINSIGGDESFLNKSFFVQYSTMKNRKLLSRKKVIALAIEMGAKIGTIDEFLKLAYMEPLCAKNYYESLLIFALALLERQLSQLSAEDIKMGYGDYSETLQERYYPFDRYELIDNILPQGDFDKIKSYFLHKKDEENKNV